MSIFSVRAAYAVPQLKTQNPEFKTPPKLVVVVANRLLLSDLEDARHPTLAKTLREGAVALISPNCAGAKTEFSVMLTAAAGASCKGGPYVAECYDSDELLPNREMAGSAYLERTGFRVTPGAVFLGIAQAQRDNATLGIQARIGALGDALLGAYRRTAAIGNADSPPLIVNRAAAVLAASSEGRIGYGDLHNSYSFHPERSYFPLPDAIVAALRKADFVVVNFGDTTRLDDEKISITDSGYAKRKDAILRELDMAVRELPAGCTVVLVSFSPPIAPFWSQLTPIVVYPSRTRGLLTSPSTRTPGLIAASDFAPTVLELMGVRRPLCLGMTGRPADEVAVGDKMGVLHELGTRVEADRVLELPVLATIAVIGIVCLTTSAIILGFALKASRKVLGALRVGMLVCACWPLAMLLAAGAPAGVAGYAVATGGLAAILVTGALTAGRYAKLRAAPVVIAFALTAAAVIIDSALGGRLCKFSVPSSYQFSGFRFYGIGNEYAGILISMAALVVIMAGRGVRERIVWAVGALIVVFLGVGRLGANYGGTVTAVLTFGLLSMSFHRQRFQARHVILFLAAGVAVAAAFAVIDWRLSGPQGSHASRMADFVDKVGFGSLVSVAGEKVLMNLRIAGSHNAERVFLAFVPFMALWLWGVQGKIKRMFEGDPAVIAGLKAVVIGAAVGFLMNDSGVVMASIMIAMTLLVLLYSLLEEARKPCPE